jgi:tetratricopeptide (TPR) repeat protein
MKRFILAVISAALGCGVAHLHAESPDGSIAFLESRVQRDALDFVAWNRLADLYLRSARISGDTRFLAKAARAAEASVKSVSGSFNTGGLGMRGRVELATHRFAAARDTAKELQELQPQKTGGLVLLCDALLELGDYSGSEAALAEAVRREGEISVGSESRHAKLDLVFGRLEKAAERFAAALAIAGQQQTAPDTVAWCQLQLGELAFRQGKWGEAENWYRMAGETLPAWYAVEDHLAELLAAQGRYDEAVAAYEKLVARVVRPELLQALGEIYVFAGKPEQARPWLEKARSLYERSAAEGEVMYLHHGSGFYADSVNEPERALEWARKDLEQRQSIYAWDALAWAQYKAGQTKPAAESIAKALATGVKDAHILYHASMIYMSNGTLSEGRKALQDAIAVNPRYNTFHAHR